MAWENVIIGWKMERCKVDKIIPAEAKEIIRIYETRAVGWISNLQAINVLVGYEYLIPVYKKQNIKKK